MGDTEVPAKMVAQAVKDIGAANLVLSSDLGQQGNMVHPDGIENMIGAAWRRACRMAIST